MFEKRERLREDPTVVDALVDPDGTAYLLAHRPPIGTHFAAVEAINLAALSEAACVDLLVGLEAQKGWLDARQQQLLAIMNARQETTAQESDSGHDWRREDVACALRLAPRTAQHRIAVASQLVSRLPSTLRLLGAGDITYRHVLALTDAIMGLDDELAAAVESRVLGRAADETPGEFRNAVKRAVMALDPASAQERHLDAVEERRVVATLVDDGMTELWALLPSPGAAAVMEAINCLAAVTSADDTRTLDQRRADGLVCLGAAVLNDRSAPRAQGLRPHIQVTVAASTLLHLDGSPAELDGYGPIPAQLARTLASDPSGTWQRILTDPESGTLLDYGTTRYRPPPSLAMHVMARDRECAFPHCHRRAYHCDLDHVVRRVDGGPTSAANLQPLCPRHHRAKDELNWTVRRGDRIGTYIWTSPTGHSYTKYVPTYATDRITDSRGREGQERKTQAAEDESSGSSKRTISNADDHGSGNDADPPPF